MQAIVSSNKLQMTAVCYYECSVNVTTNYQIVFLAVSLLWYQWALPLHPQSSLASLLLQPTSHLEGSIDANRPARISMNGLVCSSLFTCGQLLLTC